jgi:glutamate carboxypeptidase
VLIDDRGVAESRALGKAISVRGPRGREAVPRVLLAIHMDTVFAADSTFQAVSSPRDGSLRGPGVCDAKGGMLVLLFALLALQRSEWAEKISWEVLLNSDEELGSPGSTPLFLEAARRSDVGLVFEPALPDGSLVSNRKGSGYFTIVVHGKSAHAGRDSHLGRNAIHALAEFLTAILDNAGRFPGLVLNTGWIHGGGAVNIVPDLAICRVNVRVDSLQQQEAFERELRQRVAGVESADGIRIECHGGFTAPPKPLTPAIDRMLHDFRDCADALGFPLAWRPTGGICDGNRLAAAGLPTVDSLGVRGGNMHTEEEFVELDSLTERARLTALFLMRLAAGEIRIDRQESNP